MSSGRCVLSSRAICRGSRSQAFAERSNRGHFSARGSNGGGESEPKAKAKDKEKEKPAPAASKVPDYTPRDKKKGKHR